MTPIRDLPTLATEAQRQAAAALRAAADRAEAGDWRTAGELVRRSAGHWRVWLAAAQGQAKGRET